MLRSFVKQQTNLMPCSYEERSADELSNCLKTLNIFYVINAFTFERSIVIDRGLSVFCLEENKLTHSFNSIFVVLGKQLILPQTKKQVSKKNPDQSGKPAI